MERSLFRYILTHTWRQQLWILAVTVISFPLIYVNLELPKMIVNNALGGRKVPESLFGFDVDQVSYLMILSLTLLGLITLNGGIKYYLNVYRGVVGERMVRRLRHELYAKVLRFPLPHFKKASAGELIPMITAETDPIGGFIGESIGLPAFQGGLLVTYLVFIFVQDFWLGMAAIALYPPQIWLIPRLQRRINQLSKERILTTRALSDRIGDTVAGAAEIRANDTSRYERADISSRLGTIFRIRLDIYKRKFFVKFLNNFLAQITPFFFYAIGGYFVIRGQLSLGALVAVLAAYKDLIDPWKELLAWYATKEDVRVKYEQIVAQFEPPGQLPTALLESPPEELPRLTGPIAAAALTYTEDGVTNEVDRVSFEVAEGEHVAILGLGRSGKDDIARLLARVALPSSGRLTVGDINLATAHEAITGSRIAFVTQNAHVFSGTLGHNLFYGLKHRPVKPPAYEGAAAARDHERIREATQAADSTDDSRADWVDFASAGIDRHSSHTRDVLRLVAMDEEVLAFGLGARINPGADGHVVELVLEARHRLRERVASPELARFVELFDGDRFNPEISIGENLLFGTSLHPDFHPANLARNPEVRALLSDSGLIGEFEAVGEKVARLMVELFADLPAESPLFAQYSFIGPDDLPAFQVLLKKIADRGRDALTRTEHDRLIALPFKLVVGRHWVGVGDEALRQRIVAARGEFRRRFAERGVVDFLDAERFSPALTIQENILFGRPVYEQADAQARLTALTRDVALKVGLEDALMRCGLEFDVGASGARLTHAQRQRLAIARALMKNADVLVMNEATAGLDPASERRVLERVLEWNRGRTVVCALGRADLARLFDRVLVLDGGRLVEDGRFSDLEKSGSMLPKLLAA